MAPFVLNVLLVVAMLYLMRWRGVEAGKHAYRVAVARALAEREHDPETEAEAMRFLARVEAIARGEKP